MPIDTSVYPNHTVHRYDLIKVREVDKERELKARKYYQDLAANGDAEAKLMLKAHWHLTRLVLQGKEVF